MPTHPGPQTPRPRGPGSGGPYPADCPRCGDGLTILTIKIVGHPVSMMSCSSCGYRRWRSQTEAQDLTRALDQFQQTPGRAF